MTTAIVFGKYLARKPLIIGVMPHSGIILNLVTSLELFSSGLCLLRYV